MGSVGSLRYPQGLEISKQGLRDHDKFSAVRYFHWQKITSQIINNNCFKNSYTSHDWPLNLPSPSLPYYPPRSYILVKVTYSKFRLISLFTNLFQKFHVLIIVSTRKTVVDMQKNPYFHGFGQLMKLNSHNKSTSVQEQDESTHLCFHPVHPRNFMWCLLVW